MNSGESVQHEVVEGQVSAILFQNEENGFAVAVLEQSADPNQRSTVAGEIGPLSVGAYLRLHGKWMDHPKYGQQFKAAWAEQATPTTQEGLQKYLACGLFPGIGKGMAKKLVDHFGVETLEALGKGAKTLRQISGIGLKKAEQLVEAFQESSNQHRVMAELRGFGLNARQAQTLYEDWGPSAILRVTEDPYALIDRLHGLGFKTADAMATKLGILPDSEVRARGVIRHLLREARREGHVCLPETVLEENLLKLSLPSEIITSALACLVEEGIIRCEVTPEDPVATCWYYLPALYQAEISVAERIHHLLSQTAPPCASTAELKSAIQRSAWQPDASQEKAVKMALQEPFSIMTGGPGTGKTTTLQLLLDTLDSAGVGPILLASPTGRAAKRLQEATGRPASTLHRLLGWEPHAQGFRHDEDEPLEAEFLIVDEVSMLDLPLAHAIFAAVPDSCRLLFVGDADQLPSVGPGMVLRDLVNSSTVPTTRLAHIHRQTKGSGISRAAHQILEGIIPRGDPANSDGDFFVVTPPTAEAAFDVLEKLVCERIPKKYGMDPMRDVLVLSPMYKGALGVDSLNEQLGKHLNPDAPETWAGSLRVGDRMMVIKNDYDREVFNGDTGFVSAITSNEVMVEVDGRPLTYGPDDLNHILPSYCVTVHRSQGSEARAVIVIAAGAHWMMLRRNLLYTAITRGKELVVVITNPQALARAVHNADENKRFSRLVSRVQ